MAREFKRSSPTRFAGVTRLTPSPALGVFHMVDSTAANATWVKITGNLFDPAMTHALYDDPNQVQPTLKNLMSIQADWRYAIPDDLANPSGPTHPVVVCRRHGRRFSGPSTRV